MAEAGRDEAYLLDMLLAARDARAFVSGLDEAAFRASRLHQNAVIRSLEIIGEVAGKVSPATQAARPEIPWRGDHGHASPSDPRLCGGPPRSGLDSCTGTPRSVDRGSGAFDF
jgi:hypothetical protein